MRSIHEIANEISKNWKNVNFAAKPYLEAMHCLTLVSDNYGYDSGKLIVIYFLANANTWKGDTAKRIKLELKQLIK